MEMVLDIKILDPIKIPLFETGVLQIGAGVPPHTKITRVDNLTHMSIIIISGLSSQTQKQTHTPASVAVALITSTQAMTAHISTFAHLPPEI